MTTSLIHPTAIIYPGVTLGPGVVVEAFAVVGKPPVRGITARDPGPPCRTLIGAATLIGVGAVVYAGATVGEHCLLGDYSHIREGVILGDRVRLATHVSVNYDTAIGDDTAVMMTAHITGNAMIGRRCFIGPLVTTMNHREPRRGYVAYEVIGPTIGDDVLIGGGAQIAPGVHIGDRATIGAGALVVRDVQADATIMGTPGRVKE
jgi:acetyltransferase-like isoleucine patch superfamily enzyme